MQLLRYSALALAGVFAAVLIAPLHAQQVELKPGAKVKRDRYVITADEIAEHSDIKDGYDAVKTLRNQWLRVTRGSGSALGSNKIDPVTGIAVGCVPAKSDQPCTGSSGGGSPVPKERGSPYADAGASSNYSAAAGPVVYIDEIKRERLDDLKTLRPSDIFEMRYMSGTEASGRYGAGHENGAILVKTVRFGKG